MNETSSADSAIAQAPPRKSTFGSFGAYVRSYVLHFWGWYFAGSIALAATTLITLEIPQIAKSIVNLIAGQNVGSASEATGLAAVTQARNLALLVVGLGFLQMVIRALSRVLIFWPGRKLETDSKDIIFSRSLSIPDGILRKFGMGDLVSRIANDVGHLRVFFAFGILQIANLIFLSTFVVTKMFHVHPTLAGLCLLPLGATFLVFRVVMPRLHKFSLANQAALGRLTNRVTETFINFHVITANVARDAFVLRAEVENEEVYKTNIQVLLLRMVAFPLMTCLSGLAQLVVLFYGGLQVVNGSLSIGDILAFNVYIGLLAFPLTAMGIIAAVYQRAKTALVRLAEIEVSPNETDRMPLVGQMPTSSRAGVPLLEVRGLSHGYGKISSTVGSSGKSDGKTEGEQRSPFHLTDVSFALKPGQRVGLFGPIGSGKSTIFSLITCLESPPPGSIFLHGIDVATIAPGELRRRVAYGLQQVHLFSDTIRANIIFGLDEVPPESEIESACRDAQIWDEIKAFEQGWETQIGEKGLRLSGGQKQRLALARLFLRKPDLLLLDDTLSAVDQNTEQRLLASIHRRAKTLIMTSHRPSALRVCDFILVVKGGRLVDSGPFGELVRRYPEMEAGEEGAGP